MNRLITFWRSLTVKTALPLCNNLNVQLKSNLLHFIYNVSVLFHVITFQRFFFNEYKSCLQFPPDQEMLQHSFLFELSLQH